MKKYTYTKDDGTSSDRVLHGISTPANLSALDVSSLSEDDATKACRIYDQWIEEHLKPFEKKAATFKKENLKSLESMFEENGISKDIMVKSFKPRGLVEK